MRLAFLISAHTDPLHLDRLIKSLPEESDFFIHVDAKSDLKIFEDRIRDDRVKFVLPRINVTWGSIKQVEYQMVLIKSALESQNNYDYFVSMSGLDYPVWSNNKITNYFTTNKGKEYIQGICMTNQGKDARLYRQYRLLSQKPWAMGSLGSKFRVALRHIISFAGIVKPLTFKADGKEYQLYKGSSWWAITPDLAEYALKTWNSNSQYVRYFKTSFGPDETFIQTLAFNSSFADRCILTKGNMPDFDNLTPLTYIYYHPIIKILNEEDYDTIINSGKMFCRKTITGKSDKLLNLIDKFRELHPLNE